MGHYVHLHEGRVCHGVIGPYPSKAAALKDGKVFADAAEAGVSVLYDTAPACAKSKAKSKNPSKSTAAAWWVHALGGLSNLSYGPFKSVAAAKRFLLDRDHDRDRGPFRRDAYTGGWVGDSHSIEQTPPGPDRRVIAPSKNPRRRNTSKKLSSAEIQRAFKAGKRFDETHPAAAALRAMGGQWRSPKSIRPAVLTKYLQARDAWNAGDEETAEKLHDWLAMNNDDGGEHLITVDLHVTNAWSIPDPVLRAYGEGMEAAWAEVHKRKNPPAKSRNMPVKERVKRTARHAADLNVAGFVDDTTSWFVRDVAAIGRGAARAVRGQAHAAKQVFDAGLEATDMGTTAAGEVAKRRAKNPAKTVVLKSATMPDPRAGHKVLAARAPNGPWIMLETSNIAKKPMSAAAKRKWTLRARFAGVPDPVEFRVFPASRVTVKPLT